MATSTPAADGRTGRTTDPALRAPVARPGSRLLHRLVWLRLGLLLSAPLAWMLLIYVVALAALLITSLWSVDSLSSEIDRTWTLDNFRTLVENQVYRDVTVRTIGVALAVTVIDVAIALPIAFYMAKVASPRLRRMLVVAVLTPLWASYLVKVFAWRVVLSEGGPAEWSGLGSPGYGLTAVVITQAYIWLPYVILPVFAALERVPDSLLEAAGDLGANSGMVLRSVVLPLLVPGILAGGIFAFSLTMGDYITVNIVGGANQMLGNLVFVNAGAANNLPLAAAIAMIPIVVMVVLLAAIRRTGALENL
ncbi:spermidine/putrescine ABC transporter permease [Nocardioides szechwanensis]|uniref:Putative spermidine/putrescine transport system permease protein n=1 Tax=Nocardioides szechwanensis TaxID=1005944 RepID=A0A1H0KR98_9ACTN|nr:ABC transporter permease [Nocardioides szechwanensis]GEP35443.1 spermidine/putrescine ABC transporter permease [Nocardioides szechwanensis]SDO58385.1 putative spermidine/putrescine transport system permease protein [Nocardioides szechwanensis]